MHALYLLIEWSRYGCCWSISRGQIVCPKEKLSVHDRPEPSCVTWVQVCRLQQTDVKPDRLAWRQSKGGQEAGICRAGIRHPQLHRSHLGDLLSLPGPHAGPHRLDVGSSHTHGGFPSSISKSLLSFSHEHLSSVSTYGSPETSSSSSSCSKPGWSQQPVGRTLAYPSPILAATYEVQSCARHNAESSACIFPFNPPIDPVRSVLFLCPFYRWRH